MYIVVTGAAGFVGANLVKGLNARGVGNILAVDNLKRSEKFKNLVDLRFADFLDKEEFIRLLKSQAFDGVIDAVLHQGACSDTMETDGRYMMENNYRYSVTLFEHCQEEAIPFVYASSASVYGAGTKFEEKIENEAPLNIYAYSKFLFDQYVRNRQDRLTSQVVGLRYFNVYGPREDHKGRMASVAFHFTHQFQRDGYVKLFEGSGGFARGEQLRDFVSVDDVVKVNLHFFEHRDRNGIFNVGTGRAQSFNEVAMAVINQVLASRGERPRTLEDLQRTQLIRYIPFPDALVGKYQSYTQAELGQLRRAGYGAQFDDVQRGVGRYTEALLKP